MENNLQQAKKEDLRVWWCSCIPIDNDRLEIYKVEDIETAKIKIKFLIGRDLEDKSITDNVGGLWINDNHEEYEDNEGRDIFQIIEENE